MAKKNKFGFFSTFNRQVKNNSEISIVTEQKTYGSFLGVFMPTILCILGVMMYLREGWVVGNAGILGTTIIILFASSITGITAISLSTIASNVRLEAGGVFSLVSQSLGLQIGGSIGIPLFLVQALSTALYMFGFTEGWLFFFPHHEPTLVILILFFGTFLISYIGAQLAFKIQILIMIGVTLAISSIFLGIFEHGIRNPHPQLWGEFQDGSLAYLFSVFFPAVTGIMVGASLSSNLDSPRTSIPKGTLSAWGVGTAVYLLFMFWYAFMGTSEELRTNTTFSVSHSYVPLLALMGVLFSTFSASLSCLVAAPRVLQALASHTIVPQSNWLKKTHNGEPKNAIFFTAGLILLVIIIFKDLNTIAPFITQLFVIIYFIINSILAIEQQLNLVSFRPLLKTPKIIPILGSLFCLFAMFVISPLIGVLSISFIVLVYTYLSRKKLSTPWETVASGIFYNFAKWSAKKISMEKDSINRRLWKPDLILPYQDADKIKKLLPLLKDIVAPQGSVKFLHILKSKKTKKNTGIDIIKTNEKKTIPLDKYFKKNKIFSTTATIQPFNFNNGLNTSLSILKDSFFKPNSLFFTIANETNEELNTMSKLTANNGMALILWAQYMNQGLSKKKEIILWVRDQSPNWKLGLTLSNLDYAILLAYKIKQNWNGKLKFICTLNNPKNYDMTLNYLKQLVYLARMHNEVEIEVVSGDFKQVVKKHIADLHIFGLSQEIKKEFLIDLVKTTKSSCLFVRDSGIGIESALV